jgi:Zn finger protein HypA/HybF involved in hydrogenase expression
LDSSDLKWKTQTGVEDVERVGAEVEKARKEQEEYLRLRIESADGAWAEAERAAMAAESARAMYQDAKRRRELGPLTAEQETEIHQLWVQVNLMEVQAKTAETSAAIASEGAEMAEYRRARTAKAAAGAAARRTPEPSPFDVPVTRTTVKRSSADEAYPVRPVKRGRLWHLFHPRGYTRKLTPAELGIARGPATKRQSAVLSVECHKCELTFCVPWSNLPDTAAMTPPERFRFVTTNERTYPCPRCGRQFFVTWSGKEVTVMMRREQW